MEHLKTVAFAEDDAGILKVLRLACQPKYDVVGMAKTGAEAISLVREVRPNILIMDLHMPVMNGLEALKQIVPLKSTAVIMLSADQDPFMAHQAMDFGACAYMSKPFELSQIEPAMESAWHRFQTQGALEEQTRVLTENLEVRKLLEKAKGILMEQQGYTEEEAHRTIQKLCQDQGISVKELCRSLIQVKKVLGGKVKTNPSRKNVA